MNNKLSFFLSLILCFITAESYAITRIDITKGNRDPLPVALSDIGGSTSEEKDLGQDITGVIAADLERSGLFRAIDKTAFVEHLKSADAIPHFSVWRQINAAGLMVGDVKLKGAHIEVSFRLWDPYAEQQIAGSSRVGDKGQWRRAAHQIADEIYKRFTGEEGYFDSRIVYAAESGPWQKRIKEIAIMDQDGENHTYLTHDRTLNMTPRFSPDGKKILFLSYVNKRKPRVYLLDVHSKRKHLVGDFPGMSFAPRFAPHDTTKGIMSVAAGGNTQIYALDLVSGVKTKLTNDTSINTSPSYAPDGSKIVFTSDRGGKPHLYVMNSNGSGATRISFGKGIYSAPAWSPRGDLIAFTKQIGSRFYIGVMRPDGSGERTIAEGYMLEGPAWAPNGRVIMFGTQERSTRGRMGASRIHSIDLTGYNEREVITPGDASDPNWSPLLQ
jgi:TolB protein